jgi:hypothetical protein
MSTFGHPLEKDMGRVVLAWDGRQFVGHELPWNRGTTPAKIGRLQARKSLCPAARLLIYSRVSGRSGLVVETQPSSYRT